MLQSIKIPLGITWRSIHFLKDLFANQFIAFWSFHECHKSSPTTLTHAHDDRTGLGIKSANTYELNHSNALQSAERYFILLSRALCQTRKLLLSRPMNSIKKCKLYFKMEKFRPVQRETGLYILFIPLAIWRKIKTKYNGRGGISLLKEIHCCHSQ